VADQAGSGDHPRLEKVVASLENGLHLRQGRCYFAWLVVGSRGCYEHSPVASEVSRKGRQGFAAVAGGHLVRAGSGNGTFGKA